MSWWYFFRIDELPQIDVIILTTFADNESVFKALCAGTWSYISKTPLKNMRSYRSRYDGVSNISSSIA